MFNFQFTSKPAPVPPPPPPKPEPELQVAPSRSFKEGLDSAVDLGTELVSVLKGPGDALNLMSGKRFSEVRSKLDLNVPYQGVHAQSGTTPTVQDVPNPDSPDGQWDPKQFMPRMVFHKDEDAFPVAPDFDGTTTTADNAPTTANGKGSHYEDGVIGGDQGLSAAFTATKKGEYTVLTYSFYHAQNKAGHYHRNDYSTAQVYLKPGADGKLAPTHMSASWHHGSVLTKWDDIAKDPAGNPVVKVNLGSHALEVMGKGEKLPTEGLQIDGDGRAILDGKPTGHDLTFDALQTNVKNARYLDPKSEEAKPRLEAMRWGDTAMNPFLPEVYEDAPPVWEETLVRGLDFVDDKVDAGVDAVKDKVSDGYDAVKDKVEGGVDKVGDLVDDGKDVAEKAWGEIKGLL